MHISYTRSILTNGRYPSGTSGGVTCPNNFTLYGWTYYRFVGTPQIMCSRGCWKEPVDKFRCIPSDQGELKSLHSHQDKLNSSAWQVNKVEYIYIHHGE